MITHFQIPIIQQVLNSGSLSLAGSASVPDVCAALFPPPSADRHRYYLPAALLNQLLFTMQPAAIQRVKPPALALSLSLSLSLCQGQLVRRCAAPPQLLTALQKTPATFTALLPETGTGLQTLLHRIQGRTMPSHVCRVVPRNIHLL